MRVWGKLLLREPSLKKGELLNAPRISSSVLVLGAEDEVFVYVVACRGSGDARSGRKPRHTERFIRSGVSLLLRIRWCCCTSSCSSQESATRTRLVTFAGLFFANLYLWSGAPFFAQSCVKAPWRATRSHLTMGRRHCLGKARRCVSPPSRFLGTKKNPTIGVRKTPPDNK